jgi:starvation-inducible DNA-binding protein
MEEQLIEAAKIVMADTFKFYLRAHNYHWNVVGTDFFQYHQLFEKIYNEVFEAVDVIAEEIRAMDSFVPGSLGRFQELSKLSDERDQVDSITMMRRLIYDNDLVLNSIAVAYQAAEAAGNHGFSNLMADRQSAHRKHGWMLKSTISHI